MEQSGTKTLKRLRSSAEPHVAYRAALLSGAPAAEAGTLRLRMLADPRVTALLGALAAWPEPLIASHKSPSQAFHHLAFLADLGLRLGDPGVDAIVGRVLERRDAHGIPLLGAKISEAYGGTGQPVSGWALCDAPTVLYALARLGHRDAATDGAVSYLASLYGPEGWGCHVSESLGSWRGPGRKDDPCPYATLIMVKLLAEHDPDRYRERMEAGALVLLDLWGRSRDRHPYIFYMGTDFRKPKLPFIWYDILHAAEVLSRVPGVRADPRFTDMLDTLEAAAAGSGFVPSSVYQPFKAWDFGQKKVRSDSLELAVLEILRRSGR